MQFNDQLLDFVGEIYEAAYQPNHWVVVMQQLCGLLGAKSAGIFCEDYLEKRRVMVAAHGLPVLSDYSYRLGLGKFDHAYQVMLQKAEGESAIIIDHAIVKTEQPVYYKLLLKPNNVGYVAGLNIFKNEEWHIGLGIHRAFEAKQFDKADLQLIQRLHPHLQRAMRIQRTFQRVRAQNRGMKAALSQLSLGILVVREDGSLCFQNESAKNILKYHPALSIHRNCLKASSRKEQAELNAIIASCINDSQDHQGSLSHAINLSHPDCITPLTLMAARKEDAPESSDIWGLEKVAVLFISDPEVSIQISPEILKQLYGLTAAEAHLSLALLNGLSLQEVSELNRRSIKTVRTQLRHVFEKVGVNRQQDLVKVLMKNAIPSI